MRRQSLLPIIAVIQSILFLTHLFVYETWTASLEQHATWERVAVQVAVAVLSISFVAASLLAFRYTNVLIRVLYRVSAVWIGMFSFLLFASMGAWVIFGVALLAGIKLDFHRTVEVLFALAVAFAAVAVFNAGWTRITRVTVQLANLPQAWRGRRAALVSDLHLGHVRNAGFLRRIVESIHKEKPDVVFIAGDLFDGTAIDARRAVQPLENLTAPQGVYFVAGNHDQFRHGGQFADAVVATGVRVLNDEKVEVDGLQIVGVSYASASRRSNFESVLRGIGIDPNRASVLLNHAPDHPEVAEAAGVSLQVSGHTHLGQFLPWSWLVRRIYRQFAYGLNRIGNTLVLTSSGAGTWGPPLRLGSRSEIVIIHFQ